MRYSRRTLFPNRTSLLPGLDADDEREELGKIIDTILEVTPLAKREGLGEPEIKTLSDFAL